MPRLRSICLETALATGITFLLTGIASAGIHTWDVNEVFSNSDGTIQFVELWESAGGADETGVGNGTITSAATPTTAWGVHPAPYVITAAHTSTLAAVYR